MARRMGPFASPGRFASRGLFYSRELRPGVHVVAKWPVKPTGQPSELQLKYRELMADVQRWAKYRIAPEQIAAKAFSPGSPYLPKDCLIASAWGTMVAVSIKGGGIVTGVRVLASEIQSMLDTITTVPGSMLFRTSTGWRPLYPVQAGRILTDGGPGVEPSWQPPATPAAGGTGIVVSGGGSTSGSVNAAVFLNLCAPKAACTLNALEFKFPVDGSGIYKIGCAPVNWPNLSDSVQYADDVRTDGSSTVLGKFTNGVALTAGQNYAYMLIRTDGGNTVYQQIRYGGGDVESFGFVISATNTRETMTTTDPQDGDSMSPAGGSYAYQMNAIITPFA